MQIVIPMAGLGKRFSDAGYTVPKPLVPIDGVPMIVRVLGDLPSATRIICVVHPKHVADDAIDKLLQDAIPNCHIVVTPGLTEGQACTVRLAADKLEQGESVLVAACDNTHLFDRGSWDRLTEQKDLECVVWTYRGEPRVLAHPEWFGWVETQDDGSIQRISVKKPISPNPINDHVVSGTFWFRDAKRMIERIDQLVASNVRVNNEFYMDSIPNLIVDAGLKSQVFEVDKYIGWGSPEDLNDYLRWSAYFRMVCAQ